MSALPTIVGNERVRNLLDELVTSSKLPAAVAFVGPDGVGKFSVARSLALRDVCVSTNRPCGECAECTRALQGVHARLTLYNVTAGTDGSIDCLREILEKFTFVNTERTWLIISRADRLTEAAQNGLLKFLEEPPAQVQIILTVPHEDLLRPTVKSRVSVFRFQRLSPKDMRQVYGEALPEDLREADGRPGRLPAIVNDEDRQERRLVAATTIRSVYQHQPAPAPDSLSLDRLYQDEERQLRDALLQQFGLRSDVTDGRQALSVNFILRMLQRLQERLLPSSQTLSPATLYARLHTFSN